MSARTSWVGAIVLLTLAVVLSACGASSSTSSGASPVRQLALRTASGCPHHNQPAGAMTYSDWQFPDTLNPFQTTSAASYETINGLQDSLFIYNSQAHLVPMMATQLPTVQNGGVTDGGKTIVVHLKKGLRWSNGTEITSHDVLFGWKVGMDKATGPYCTGSCDQIARIDTPDRYTAVFHFKTVFAPGVATAMPPIWPAVWSGTWNNDAHAAATKLGQDPSFNFESRRFPTSGAYQVASFIKDDRIVMHPMQYYSDMICGGFVQNMIFSFYSSKPSMIAAAASPATDVTQDYTTADLTGLRQHSGSYTIYSQPGFDFEHMEFNVDPTFNGRANPLSNQNVRLALALALDKIGLIRSSLVVNKKTAQSIASWTPWVNTPQLVQPYADTKTNGQWDPIAGSYVMPGTPQALADARTLLARTPWAHGFSLSISTTTGNPVRAAELGVAQNNWSKIGVSVVPNFIPATKLFSGWATGGPLNHGQFQVAMFSFIGSPEPDTFKYELQSRFIDRQQQTHTAINENYSGVNDPVINRAFDSAAHTFDPGVRAKNYNVIQERLDKQAYWIGLYFRPSIATADPSVVGFSNNPTQLGPTWNMYAWKGASLA